MSLRVNDVTVIDPAPSGPRVLEDVSVRIVQGRVEEIGPDLPGAERVVDGRGGLLIPGLVNAHAHAAMTLFRGYADDLPLHEWLKERIWPVEAHLTPDAVRAGARLGVAEMLAGGVTGFADMYLFEHEVAAAAENAGIRCLAGASIVDFETPEGPAEAALDRAEAFLDEHPPDAEGLVRGSIAPHSAYACDADTLAACGQLSRERGAILQTHVAETRREVYELEHDTGKRPIARLDAQGCLTERSVLAHGGWLTKDEARTVGQAGAALAHCPTANMKLATGGYAPVPELAEAGATVALGSDGPASNNTLDLLQEAKRAALVHKHHRWQADVLPAHEVLAMATREAAVACGFEDAGRVCEGARADLALVDVDGAHMAPVHDPVSQVVYAARPGDVRTTIVDGQLVYHDREHRTLDLAEARRNAREAAQALVAKVDNHGL